MAEGVGGFAGAGWDVGVGEPAVHEAAEVAGGEGGAAGPDENPGPAGQAGAGGEVGVDGGHDTGGDGDDAYFLGFAPHPQSEGWVADDGGDGEAAEFAGAESGAGEHGDEGDVAERVGAG